MTPLEMVERAVAHGNRHHQDVVNYVWATFKRRMRPSVAGNLLTVIRKKTEAKAASKVPPPQEVQPSHQEKAREAVLTNPRLAAMIAKFNRRAGSGCATPEGVIAEATAAKEALDAAAAKIVTVEFGEEVVKAVIVLINEFGYDRVRGAVELASWFYR